MAQLTYSATAVKCTFLLWIAFSAFGQTRPAKGPQPLFFRESWREAVKIPRQEPLTQDFVTNPNLELKLYETNKEGLTATQSAKDVPPHVWNGLCSPTCALALRDKGNYADLTGPDASIRLLTKVNGFHQVRPLLKLADGTWLVGDQATGYSSGFRESELYIADIRWKHFDIKAVLEANDGKWMEQPDLSKVDEIGWTDLTPGNGHGNGGWSDVGWIEVYGKPVARGNTTQSDQGR